VVRVHVLASAAVTKSPPVGRGTRESVTGVAELELSAPSALSVPPSAPVSESATSTPPNHTRTPSSYSVSTVTSQPSMSESRLSSAATRVATPKATAPTGS
jgi:hypothetical protein